MSRRDRIEDYVVILDNFLADGFALILAIVWFWAFFTDDRVAVTINDYGEKWPELFLWPVIFGIVLWGSWIRLRRYRNRD